MQRPAPVRRTARHYNRRGYREHPPLMPPDTPLPRCHRAKAANSVARRAMPSEDYAAVGGGGALRIKGAKVQKKKKKRDKSDLEKNLASGEDSDKALVKSTSTSSKAEGSKRKDKRDADDDDDNERRDKDGHSGEEDDAPAPQKTEAERRYDEVKKKRLLEMTRASGARPELLKTHKERVEELNTYLSKLSEHHDMPKIGPG
ncbi:hypothetical protein PCL_00708 [Purpureocillium lilacinum]|uniref:DUF1754-domain-containing protein n=1 Tax=Purpureocillium lilacinum TaxID=33203 RepID=A0A2U3E5N4_PURLI|nr:hypothetical protein PCL_00708 [Purpureocillium lilacinum]